MNVTALNRAERPHSVRVFRSTRNGQRRQLILDRLDPDGSSIDFDRRRSPSKLLKRSRDLWNDVKRAEPRPNQVVKRSQVIRTWPPLFTSFSVSSCRLECQPAPLAVVAGFPSTEGSSGSTSRLPPQEQLRGDRGSPDRWPESRRGRLARAERHATERPPIPSRLAHSMSTQYCKQGRYIRLRAFPRHPDEVATRRASRRCRPAPRGSP